MRAIQEKRPDSNDRDKQLTLRAVFGSAPRQYEQRQSQKWSMYGNWKVARAHSYILAKPLAGATTTIVQIPK